MKKGLFLGLNILFLAFSLFSIIAFLTMQDELRGVVYQLPRHAADYKRRIEPICVAGQDMDYVQLPGPPPVVVIKMDNCATIGTKKLTRGATDFALFAANIAGSWTEAKKVAVKNTIKEAGGEFTKEAIKAAAKEVGRKEIAKIFLKRGMTSITASTLTWHIALTFDVDPADVLDKYEMSMTDTFTVLSHIAEEEEGEMIRVPVGIDTVITVSGKISTASELKDNQAIEDANTAEGNLRNEYPIIRDNLYELFDQSLRDRAYADSFFSATAMPALTIVGDGTKVFLRPEHADRFISDLSRETRSQCRSIQRGLDLNLPLHQILNSECQELVEKLEDRTILMSEQDFVSDEDGLDPWENATRYFEEVEGNFDQVCVLQRDIFGPDGMEERRMTDFCDWYQEINGKVSAVDLSLERISQHFETMVNAKDVINGPIRRAFVSKEDEAKTQGVSLSEVDMIAALDEGRCVGNEIPLRDEDGNVVTTLKVPTCAFQVSCNKEDLVFLGYEESCMIQLINVEESGYEFEGDVMPIKYLPGTDIDLPTAAELGVGHSIGVGVLRALRWKESPLFSTTTAGAECKTSDESEFVFCLEAEEGCYIGQHQCRFCYSFQCNAPVKIESELQFGVSMKHEGDRILIRGNLLPL